MQILIARAGWLLRRRQDRRPRRLRERRPARPSASRRRFASALALHRRLGLTRWLAQELADRFERLLIVRMGLQQLLAFNERQLSRCWGSAVGEELTLILGRRVTGVEQALAALRLQFPEFARTLESRYLERVAAQLEGAEYGDLLAEFIISREIHNDLDRHLSARWRELERRPVLDIELRREQLIARVPLFGALDAQRLRAIARLLRPRLALPGERIIARGDRGDAMYFIASGAVEVRSRPAPVRLGSGDFFGEIALVAPAAQRRCRGARLLPPAGTAGARFRAAAGRQSGPARAASTRSRANGWRHPGGQHGGAVISDRAAAVSRR